MLINTIWSGAQAGSDRAGIDVAIAYNIPYRGYIPKGRIAEDGIISDKYIYLKESYHSGYEKRTELNVMCSDGTLLFYMDKPTPGTQLTINYCHKYKKPYMELPLSKEINYENITKFIKDNKIFGLNIAGTRESKAPGIYVKVYSILEKLLAPVKVAKPEPVYRDDID